MNLHILNLNNIIKQYLWDEQDGLKRMDAVGIRRGSLAELNGCDARTPHVCTAIVGRLTDHLHTYQQANN